jgi:peptidoglycan/LPS O-acetylase OafA/YrhL
MGGKIADIQRLRGIAVLLTVLAHQPLATGIFHYFGYRYTAFSVGVPLFFCN